MSVERKTFVVLGRISFPALFEPNISTNEQGDVKKMYEAQLIIQKDEPSLAPLQEHLAAMLKDKFGAKPAPSVKRGLRDGSEKPNLAGMSDDVAFLTARSKNKPPVVDQKKVGITDPDKVFGGCWVKLAVTPFAFDQGMNKGLSFALDAVQFIREDEHFGSVVDPDALFGEEDVPGATASNTSGW